MYPASREWAAVAFRSEGRIPPLVGGTRPIQYPQAMRAILAARATVTSLTCILDCNCRSHALIGLAIDPGTSRMSSHHVSKVAKIAVPALANAKHLGLS
jgi:hypothetical protein